MIVRGLVVTMMMMTTAGSAWAQSPPARPARPNRRRSPPALNYRSLKPRRVPRRFQHHRRLQRGVPSRPARLLRQPPTPPVPRREGSRST